MFGWVCGLVVGGQGGWVAGWLGDCVAGRLGGMILTKFGADFSDICVMLVRFWTLFEVILVSF